MSRYSRDDDRSDLPDHASDVRPERQAHRQTLERDEEAPLQGLTLPRGDEREVVEFRGREYSLNGSEIRALATVGAFRVVSPEDFEDDRHGRDVSHGDWRQLAEQGLLTHETITDRHGAHHVVALTREGKALLDAHTTHRSDGRQQVYYAGVVKPRERAHDSRLYGAFREEAGRIEREGGRLTRVILDYELKRDFQKFLNRDDRPDETNPYLDRWAFASTHDLHVIGGHLELPDLRIEYETEDGRIEHRDVELVTEHYSRGQLAGKARAGFACYRTAGSGRGRGGRSQRGGRPFDPRHLERLS